MFAIRTHSYENSSQVNADCSAGCGATMKERLGRPLARPMVRALGSGVFAAASVALYRVHDLTSLTAVFRHLVRDWYELPVFLAVAVPIFYAYYRDDADGSHDSTIPPDEQATAVIEPSGRSDS